MWPSARSGAGCAKQAKSKAQTEKKKKAKGNKRKIAHKIDDKPFQIIYIFFSPLFLSARKGSIRAGVFRLLAGPSLAPHLSQRQSCVAANNSAAQEILCSLKAE